MYIYVYKFLKIQKLLVRTCVVHEKTKHTKKPETVYWTIYAISLLKKQNQKIYTMYFKKYKTYVAYIYICEILAVLHTVLPLTHH